METYKPKVARTVTATFEIFEPTFDKQDAALVASDPTSFFRNMLKTWGIPINGLFLDHKLLKSGINENVLRGTTVWHCTAPPAKASETIIITRPE